jgi:hypothetical protein
VEGSGFNLVSQNKYGEAFHDFPHFLQTSLDAELKYTKTLLFFFSSNFTVRRYVCLAVKGRSFTTAQEPPQPPPFCFRHYSAIVLVLSKKCFNISLFFFAGWLAVTLIAYRV